MIKLTSERFHFIPLTGDHFDHFAALEMDDEVMEFYTSRPHGTIEEARQSFDRYMKYQTQVPELGGWAVSAKDNMEFVGLGVLIHLELNPLNTFHEVGYRLPKSAWGKGIATEICKTLLDYGFNELGFTEIKGTTHPDHKVSQKVLLKCGMKEVGSVSNYGGATMFRVLKEEWE